MRCCSRPAAARTRRSVGPWEQPQPVIVALVLIASLALAAVAWSSAFERFYLPLAQVVVPLRNSLAAICIARVAGAGQPEALMLLPLMVIGPFYFMGLRFRMALLSVAVTVVSFAVSAAVSDLALPVALRSFVFVLLTAVACAIAARYLETWSRTSFLESHLIEELAHHDTSDRRQEPPRVRRASRNGYGSGPIEESQLARDTHGGYRSLQSLQRSIRASGRRRDAAPRRAGAAEVSSRVRATCSRATAARSSR